MWRRRFGLFKLRNAGVNAMSFKTDFLSVTESFREQNIDYATCGAVALAIHGFFRATPGIDIIVASNSIDDAKDITASPGFQPSNEKRRPSIAIELMAKVCGQQRTALHFLNVTPMVQSAWNSQTWFDIDDQRCCVVSRDGLIRMKQSSGRLSDDADIQRLIDPASHDPFLPKNPDPPLMTAAEIGRRLECQSQLLALCLMLGSTKFAHS